MKPSPKPNGTGSAADGDALDPNTSSALRHVIANLDAILVVAAISIVGWTMPLGDRFGFVLGLALAGLGSLAIFSRRW